MKRRILSFFAPAVVVLGGLFFTSCNDDSGADYINEFYTIGRAEWSLNSSYERYEVFKRNLNIDNEMYEYGLSDAYMWIEDIDSNGRPIESRKQLPYTYTVYDDNVEGRYYDITFDYDIRPNGIMFEIRTIPDLIPRSYIPDELDFKVSLMWRW